MPRVALMSNGVVLAADVGTVFRFTPGSGWDQQTIATNAFGESRLSLFEGNQAVLTYPILTNNSVVVNYSLYTNGEWQPPQATPYQGNPNAPVTQESAMAPTGETVLVIDGGPSAATWLRP